MICYNIVYPKSNSHRNNFENNYHSRNKNIHINQNSFYNKNDLSIKGNGTILKDINSSVVHNDSYAEENNEGNNTYLIEKAKNKENYLENKNKSKNITEKEKNDVHNMLNNFSLMGKILTGKIYLRIF